MDLGQIKNVENQCFIIVSYNSLWLIMIFYLPKQNSARFRRGSQISLSFFALSHFICNFAPVFK